VCNCACTPLAYVPSLSPSTCMVNMQVVTMLLHAGSILQDPITAEALACSPVSCLITDATLPFSLDMGMGSADQTLMLHQTSLNDLSSSLKEFSVQYASGRDDPPHMTVAITLTTVLIYSARGSAYNCRGIAPLETKLGVPGHASIQRGATWLVNYRTRNVMILSV
jgi:hypothetical protein